jgi:hypothetical protein
MERNGCDGHTYCVICPKPLNRCICQHCFTTIKHLGQLTYTEQRFI